MSISRRGFFKLAATVGATAAVGKKAHASSANKHFEGYEGSYGVLHDTTRCVGCRSCEDACNRVNNKPKPEKPFDDLSVLDKKRRVETGRFTVVNRYDGVGKGGSPVFRKMQCNHCLEPACANACFVHAFHKSPEGPVVYDPSVCVGCRFCLLACPWSLPGYEYDNPTTPVVIRCTMCYPRIKEGKLPGCVEACPMEALTFGKRDDLLKIARKRIKDHPERYKDHIFGEKEIGGTSWLYIAGVDFNDLGLSTHVPHSPPPELTAGALGAVPMVVGLWPVLLTGIYAMSKRKEKIAAQELAQAVQQNQQAADATLAERVKKEKENAKKSQEMAVNRAVKKAIDDYKKELEQAAQEKTEEKA